MQWIWLTGLVWKVYKGYKKSTKQDAAIFVFEKRILDRWDKQEREAMLDRLRKGVSQLTRLRHPQVSGFIVEEGALGHSQVLIR